MPDFEYLQNLVKDYVFETKIDKDEINELKKTIDMKIARLSKDSFLVDTKKDKDLLTPEVQKKIQDLIYTCRTTDDYEEYTKSRRELCMLTGVSSKKIIRSGSADAPRADNGYFYVATHNKKEQKKSASLPPGTKLYHTSSVPNLTELKPTFRAGSLTPKKYKNGLDSRYFSADSMYPSKRVYFFIDNPGSRTTTSNEGKYVAKEGEYVYQYTGSLANVKYDTEGGNGKSVYIETDKPVPVKDVTSQFKEKNVKESVVNLKLEIYESCYHGEISEEERNQLLSIID